jgi:hypothetical protein
MSLSPLEMAFAQVGLVALIEATGYQEVRAPDALQKLLAEYLPAEYDEWQAALFGDEPGAAGADAAGAAGGRGGPK